MRDSVGAFPMVTPAPEIELEVLEEPEGI